MTTIPEEAVFAAARALCNHGAHPAPTPEHRLAYVNEKWPRFKEEARLALTAALPHLPGVGVKKLGWVATGQTGFLETEFYAVAGPLMHTVHPLKDVDGPFNEHYSIHRDWNDRETWRVTYYVGNNGLSGISKACKSLEAAKAAAQADYSARILSALEPSAAREKALEEAARIAEAMDGVYDSKVGSYAAAAIRALSSPDHADVGKVEGDGWLPIEGAPKDAYVLAWGDNFHWRGVEKAYVHSDYNGHIGVICRHGVAGTPFSGRDAPTHWSPLPSAPSQEVATTHPSGGNHHGE